MLFFYTICLMMDLAALTLDGSYIHECMWISWKYNKDEDEDSDSYMAAHSVESYVLSLVKHIKHEC